MKLTTNNFDLNFSVPCVLSMIIMHKVYSHGANFDQVYFFYLHQRLFLTGFRKYFYDY